MPDAKKPVMWLVGSVTTAETLPLTATVCGLAPPPDTDTLPEYSPALNPAASLTHIVVAVPPKAVRVTVDV